jgi:hypothetical protein
MVINFYSIFYVPKRCPFLLIKLEACRVPPQASFLANSLYSPLSLIFLSSCELFPTHSAMEVASGSGDKAGFFTQGRSWLKALPVKFKANMVGMARNIKKLGQEDPRRVVHSLKVGLALTLVSTLYYLSLSKTFGVDAIWAVMTVVLVFEFSVGKSLTFLKVQQESPFMVKPLLKS